jgi:hypothetical protein
MGLPQRRQTRGAAQKTQGRGITQRTQSPFSKETLDWVKKKEEQDAKFKKEMEKAEKEYLDKVVPIARKGGLVGPTPFTLSKEGRERLGDAIQAGNDRRRRRPQW